jgi:large subunit ribosomal protein L33
MAKSEKRIKVGMKCSDCSEKNYSTYKNKQNTADKMNFNKYCPRCRKHTPHKEVK